MIHPHILGLWLTVKNSPTREATYRSAIIEVDASWIPDCGYTPLKPRAFFYFKSRSSSFLAYTHPSQRLDPHNYLSLLEENRHKLAVIILAFGRGLFNLRRVRLAAKTERGSLDESTVLIHLALDKSRRKGHIDFFPPSNLKLPYSLSRLVPEYPKPLLADYSLRIKMKLVFEPLSHSFSEQGYEASAAALQKDSRFDMIHHKIDFTNRVVAFDLFTSLYERQSSWHTSSEDRIQSIQAGCCLWDISHFLKFAYIASPSLRCLELVTGSTRKGFENRIPTHQLSAFLSIIRGQLPHLSSLSFAIAPTLSAEREYRQFLSEESLDDRGTVKLLTVHANCCSAAMFDLIRFFSRICTSDARLYIDVWQLMGGRDYPPSKWWNRDEQGLLLYWLRG